MKNYTVAVYNKTKDDLLIEDHVGENRIEAIAKHSYLDPYVNPEAVINAAMDKKGMTHGDLIQPIYFHNLVICCSERGAEE